MIALIIIVLLSSGGNALMAQSEEARPLRTVRSDPAPSAARRPPPAHSHSLLTPAALRQELTQRYIAQYTTQAGIAWLNSVMEEGILYLPFIKAEIAGRGMPPELAYLPVIESGFQSAAQSKSGAVGLWQFMMNSIAPFDIKVNDLVDERRDFQKSTRGALAKLEDNYRILGDWTLALAAYNSGLGAVNRILGGSSTRDYWELCRRNEFRSETVQYIPKLLAVSYILSQPRRFGIDIWHPSVEWTAIPLERPISLDTLASESGANRELLRRLNTELLQGISPSDRNYRLKVPLAQLPQITEVLRRPPERPRFGGVHVVRRGETLWSLSRRYGVQAQALAEANDMELTQILPEGKALKVPIIE